MSAVLAETSAGALGPLILIGSLAAMVWMFTRGLRSGRASERVRRGPLYGGSAAARAPGSAGDIADGGQVPAQELLGALAVRAPRKADDDSEDGGTGHMLGLRYHRWRHRSSDLWDPTVYEGKRGGHQVFIRLGRNASVRGPGMNFRRYRSVCAVRVAVPEFELSADDGVLRSGTALPPAVMALLDQLAPSPDVWHDLRIVAGPDGLVASRGIAEDWLGGWTYDLWLLERLAVVLDGRPLQPVPLRRDWSPPYEMGTWAPTLAAAFGGS